MCKMFMKTLKIIITCVPFHFIVTLTQSLKIELNDNDDNNKEDSALIQNDNIHTNTNKVKVFCSIKK